MKNLKRKKNISIKRTNQPKIPGYKRLLDSQYNWKFKLIWTGAILICILPCLVQIGIRIAYYFKYPVTVDIHLKQLNAVKFPAVILCNDQMVLMFKDKWESCYEQKDYSKCNTSEDDYIITKLNRMQHDKISLEKHCPFFENCSRKRVSEDAENESLHTMYGECLVLRLKDKMNYKGPNTWILISWKHSELFENQTEVDFRQKDHVFIYLSDKNWNLSAHKALYDSETLRVGFRYNMRVTAKEFNQVNIPTNPCVDSKKRLTCLKNCFNQKLCQEMKCRLPFIEDDYCKNCSSFKEAIKAFIKAEQFYIKESFKICDCTRSCNELIYKLQVDNKQSSQDDAITAIRLLYSDDILEVYNETRSFTLSELISEIGGSVGLYLGVCLLSIFEMVETMLLSFSAGNEVWNKSYIKRLGTMQ